MKQKNTPMAGKQSTEFTGWKSYLLPVLLVMLLFASILGSQVNMIARTKAIA